MNRALDPPLASTQDGKPPPDPYDFSLVLGGPLYQLLCGAHLSGDALEHVRARTILIPLFVWLPLLILSVIQGHAWGDSVQVPFLADIEVHVRFLLALPLLVVAELVVHQRMRPLVRQFLERGLIPPASRARFDAALPNLLRLRNSVLAELLLIALVYLLGVLYVWPNYVALKVPTWYSPGSGRGDSQLSAAGWWFVYVSLPFFQFVLLRWYFRLFIWTRFLWQVARCELSLVPTHPDGAGGLGFLSATVVAFAPLLAAHGAALAGLMANQIFFESAKLLDFKIEVAVVVAFLLLVVLGPLLLFTPHLAKARRVGLREYGTLAQQYVREFDTKWLRDGAPAGERLLGSADIQSLGDMSNSFEVIRSMNLVPFTRTTLIELAAITLLPVAPLILTMVSVEELLGQLLRVVF